MVRTTSKAVEEVAVAEAMVVPEGPDSARLTLESA